MKNKKRAYRRKCEKQQKRRLRELYDLYGYAACVYKKDRYCVKKGKDNHKHGSYYWLKKYSNHKVRRNKDLNLKRSEYKKVFDLWWTYF